MKVLCLSYDGRIQIDMHVWGFSTRSFAELALFDLCPNCTALLHARRRSIEFLQTSFSVVDGKMITVWCWHMVSFNCRLLVPLRSMSLKKILDTVTWSITGFFDLGLLTLLHPRYHCWFLNVIALLVLVDCCAWCGPSWLMPHVVCLIRIGMWFPVSCFSSFPMSLCP